jgi:hypothetical protein
MRLPLIVFSLLSFAPEGLANDRCVINPDKTLSVFASPNTDNSQHCSFTCKLSGTNSSYQVTCSVDGVTPAADSSVCKITLPDFELNTVVTSGPAICNSTTQ